MQNKNVAHVAKVYVIIVLPKCRSLDIKTPYVNILLLKAVADHHGLLLCLKRMLKRNKEYMYAAKRLIRNHPSLADLKDSGARIAYLESDEEKAAKGKTVCADCNLVSKKYKWCCDYDFFIVVYEPNITDFTPEQIEILLLHELMHCGISFDGKEPTYYIVPHDVEDFREILDTYGIDWARQGMA